MEIITVTGGGSESGDSYLDDNTIAKDDLTSLSLQPQVFHQVTLFVKFFNISCMLKLLYWVVKRPISSETSQDKKKITSRFYFFHIYIFLNLLQVNITSKTGKIMTEDRA